MTTIIEVYGKLSVYHIMCVFSFMNITLTGLMNMHANSYAQLEVQVFFFRFTLKFNT